MPFLSLGTKKAAGRLLIAESCCKRDLPTEKEKSFFFSAGKSLPGRGGKGVWGKGGETTR
jgi:hypothetical protein